jgi:hypothetical protein
MSQNISPATRLNRDSIQFCQSIIKDALEHIDIRAFLECKLQELNDQEPLLHPDMIKTVLAAHQELCQIKDINALKFIGSDSFNLTNMS